MFFVDIPYIPVHDTPMVLTQSASTGPGSRTEKIDYLLNLCQETESTGDPTSAMRGVDPAGWLALELGSKSNRDILNNPKTLSSIKVSLLKGTTHGKIFAEIGSEGFTSYHYDPIPEYTGKDQAIFIAEFEGKTYKIVVNLIVQLAVDEKSPQCPQPQLIKNEVNTVMSGNFDFDKIFIKVSYQPKSN